jgi:site-specific DNA recombinase
VVTPSPTRFFLYARKSTDEPDRQIRSIDDQLVEMRQLAVEQNITIIEVLIEKQSAKSPGRPIFNQMLDRIEAGEASGILAWHPDRLARNSLDGGRIIYLLDTGKITELRFRDSSTEPTSHGKLMLGISFGMSKYHSDNFSDGIKRVQRRKVQEGLWPQSPPLGYLFDHTTRGIAPDPERAPLVRKTFELYASGGYTLTRLRTAVNELGFVNRRHRNGEGGGPLSISQYQRILTNPIYYGVMRFNDELHVAKHAPLITKQLFDAAQEILECRSKPNVRGPVSCLYRGTFRCGECGASITSEIKKGHEYLRCTKKLRPCSQRYVRIEEVRRQVAEQVSRFAIPDALADLMIRELEIERKHQARARAETVARLRDKIKAVEERLRRLMALYMEKAISVEEYRDQKNCLIGESRELDDQLIDLETTGGSWLEPAISRAGKPTRDGWQDRTRKGHHTTRPRPHGQA